MLQFVIMEIRGAQGHYEVAKTDQRAILVGKEANNNVPIQYRHRGLTLVLKKSFILNQHPVY